MLQTTRHAAAASSSRRSSVPQGRPTGAADHLNGEHPPKSRRVVAARISARTDAGAAGSGGRASVSGIMSSGPGRAATPGGSTAARCTSSGEHMPADISDACCCCRCWCGGNRALPRVSGVAATWVCCRCCCCCRRGAAAAVEAPTPMLRPGSGARLVAPVARGGRLLTPAFLSCRFCSAAGTVERTCSSNCLLLWKLKCKG